MINCPCHCGQKLEVPEEMAGGMIQCPQCHRLVDIPRLSEINSIQEDGTIRLTEAEPEPETRRDADLRRYYEKSRLDDGGEEYDLRTTMDDLRKAGDAPPGPGQDDAPPAPKYDPETGELIQSLAVNPHQPPPQHPALAPEQRVIRYASDGRLGLAQALQVPIRLLNLGNAAVLFMILLLHALALGCTLFMGMLFGFMGAFIWAGAYILIYGHYANIVEDIGPLENDELPAPARGAGWWDDVLRPFGLFLVALLLCYLPLWFIPHHPFIVLAALGLGTVLFPAVFLTLTTSGSILNLRPDRLLGSILRCRAAYAVAVLLWAAAAALNIFGILFLSAAGFAIGGEVVGRSIAAPPLMVIAAAAAALLAGTYLMHWFCWHLGLIYRAHHAKFPWILQHHIPKNPVEPPPRARRSHVDKPPRQPRTPTASKAPTGAKPPLRVLPVDSEAMRAAPTDRRSGA